MRRFIGPISLLGVGRRLCLGAAAISNYEADRSKAVFGGALEPTRIIIDLDVTPRDACQHPGTHGSAGGLSARAVVAG